MTTYIDGGATPVYPQTRAAERWMRAVFAEQDMSTAWALTHPVLRSEIVERTLGTDVDHGDLATATPTNPEWASIASVILTGLQVACPEADWSSYTPIATEPAALDTESVIFGPPAPPPDLTVYVLRLSMVLADGSWLVRGARVLTTHTGPAPSGPIAYARPINPTSEDFV